MIILIVEDKPEEQSKAMLAASFAGFKPVVADTLEDAKRLGKKLKSNLVGIITDMHFPDSKQHDKQNPNGISILSFAVDNKIPISVCTDVDHHFCNYITDLLPILSNLTGYIIPITMDKKDWGWAVRKLEIIIENQSKEVNL